MPDFTNEKNQALLSPVPASEESESRTVEDGVGLCLSGGGYRAMLFHVGSLWRLNELGWLPKIQRISSVSGGSITAAVLGMNWKNLTFNAGVATNFGAEVVQPTRKLAGASIDVASVVSGMLLPGVTIADRVAERYAQLVFGYASLQDFPDPPAPEFVLCATNAQSGSLMRFSKKRLADWQVGELSQPSISLARAVAASAAFPPVLSPAELHLKPGQMQPLDGAALNAPPYSTDIVLSDGGVYDNLGLETVWKRLRTVLVSDAGQKMAPEPTPAGDWPRHMIRILDIIDNQVRSLRKRQVIASYEDGSRSGAYWGIRTNILDYQLAGVLDCPHSSTLQLASVPTRLCSLEERVQEQLINWGYAVCDAAMRKHVIPGVDCNEAAFPYPGGVS